MAARRLVLDANSLVRAVLGRRVKSIITTHAIDAEIPTTGPFSQLRSSSIAESGRRTTTSLALGCPPGRQTESSSSSDVLIELARQGPVKLISACGRRLSAQ